jgi:hypothetical protein
MEVIDVRHIFLLKNNKKRVKNRTKYIKNRTKNNMEYFLYLFIFLFFYFVLKTGMLSLFLFHYKE